MLKKLCEREILKNENATVTAVIKQEQVQRYESEQIVNRTFGGSLPQFITAFMGDRNLTKSQADKLKKLIDSFKEEVMEQNSVMDKVSISEYKDKSEITMSVWKLK